MKPTRQDAPAQPERPIPDAYWIIPGRLLAGPYPGSRREGMVRQRLLRFLAAGITLFLDLTEEGKMGMVHFGPAETEKLVDKLGHTSGWQARQFLSPRAPGYGPYSVDAEISCQADSR
jgi:hypothetical protein